MTIDPSILLNVQQPKVEDPMTRYSNFLAMQQAINKQDEYERTLNDQKALNAVYRNALGADGGLDETKLLTGLASNNLGAKIPDVRKGLLELKDKQAGITKTEADAGKVRAETVAQKMRLLNDRMAGARTGADLLRLNDEMYADPDLGAYFTSLGGSREKGIAEINQAAASPNWNAYVASKKQAALGIEKTLQNRINVLDNGNENVVLRTNEYGDPNPTVLAKYKVGESPKAAKTTINVSTGGKIEEAGGKAFSEEQGKYLSETLKTARMAPQMIRDADRAIALINSGVFSGKAANFQAEAARTMKAMGIPVGPEVTNTEQLSALLADKVLNAIHTSGLGARGMDTPAERVYVEKAKLGDKTLDRETLITGANLLRKSAEYAIRNYNDVAGSVPQSWFQGSGAPRTLPLPSERKKPGGTSTQSKAVRFESLSPEQQKVAIERLRANPNTAGAFDQHFGKPGLAAQILGRKK